MSNPRCYRGHSLKCTTDGGNWTCNMCNKLYEGPRFGCHEHGCDYDICHKCIDNVNNVVCPNHHLLMVISYGGDWTCDNHIDFPVFSGGTCLGCNQEGCDYCLCSKCTHGLIPIPMPIHRRVKCWKGCATNVLRFCKYSISLVLALVGIQSNSM